MFLVQTCFYAHWPLPYIQIYNLLICGNQSLRIIVENHGPPSPQKFQNTGCAFVKVTYNFLKSYII